MQGGEERPLICIGDKLFVYKKRVALPLCPALEGEGNQIPKAALWYGILRRKQPVVRLKAQFMTASYCLRQQPTAKLSGIGSGNRL